MWTKVVDAYLMLVDCLPRAASRLCSWLFGIGVVRLTTAGLVAAYVCVLLSCQSGAPRWRPLPRETEESPSAPRAVKREEPLYVARSRVVLRDRAQGSPTGSLWADTPHPKAFGTDQRRDNVGDMVRVSIPPEDRYKAPPAGPTATPGTSPSEQILAKLERPDADAMSTPIADFPMEIVDKSQAGWAYLRAQRSLPGGRTAVWTARAPLEALWQDPVPVAKLFDFHVSTGQGGDYASAGWDHMVAKKIQELSPGAQQADEALQGLGAELAGEARALRERSRALAAERERMAKERARATPTPGGPP